MTDIAFAQTAPGFGGPGQMLNFLPLVLVFVVFYFLLIRPQQKKAKDHQQMLTRLKKNDEVMTSGGIYGKVVALADNVVTFKFENVSARAVAAAEDEVAIEHPERIARLALDAPRGLGFEIKQCEMVGDWWQSPHPIDDGPAVGAENRRSVAELTLGRIGLRQRLRRALPRAKPKQASRSARVDDAVGSP